MRGVVFITASLMYAGALFMAGCGPVPGSRVDSPPLEKSENLVFLDPDLSASVRCDKLVADRLPSGRLHVLVSFYNQDNDTVEAQIKIKFRDELGNAADETTWMPLDFSRRELSSFEYTSLSSSARDFTVMLRRPKITQPR